MQLVPPNELRPPTAVGTADSEGHGGGGPKVRRVAVIAGTADSEGEGLSRPKFWWLPLALVSCGIFALPLALLWLPPIAVETVISDGVDIA